jgi:hypothetical protein
MDGSAAIRRPWLTPHSHSNRRRRKNANDAGVEAWDGRELCAGPYEAEPSSPFLLMWSQMLRCSTSKWLKTNIRSDAPLSLIARTALKAEERE